ncbi:hypothetical protein [Polyangium spumosum]|uniref:YHYH protein n=1 Tax=Polyangium spumosum TaxID=889282 RepID=A0A6N7PL12_9BACT|nr:hypothetical protein [Polyangium spumosum]MRG92753.1 hypothetical protein [Polyangium spumosum]
MRTRIGLLTCALALLACSGASEPTEETVGSAEQSLSYNAIRASLNAPPKPFWTNTDEAILSPVWVGDNDRGSVYAPLWRGANANIEDLIIAPPGGDCRNVKGTVRVDWDKAANTVRITLKGRNIPRAPVVERTEGVDYFHNPFHLRQKDLLVTGYRLWTIFGTINTALTSFYYDADTNLLLGSEYDFPGGPPPNSITVGFPIFPLVSSIVVNPDAQGRLYHQYTIPYDHVTQEGGQTGAAIVTNLPHDLCQSNPADPTAGQLRPYVYGWLPPNTGPSFADILRAGVIFDMSIEDAATPYPNNDPPYVFSGASLISNFAGMQGGTPNGYHLHLNRVVRNVAPVIHPIPGGNGLGCQPFLATPHVTGPNFCAQ